jgi:NAD(P) transhydrogenase subunit alpha
MADGSVIVDLAAEQGGNCALTESGKVVVRHGVTIIGYTDLPSRLPTQASRLYATNVKHLLTDLCPGKNGELVVNMDDEVIRGATVIKAGEITWPPPPPRLSKAPPKPAPAARPPAASADGARREGWGSALVLLAGALAFFAIGAVAPREFLNHLTVFVLAVFIGYKVIWSVTPALHTPLMSVTNAISGIIVLGALLQVSGPLDSTVTVLAVIAVLISTINIAGGFLVTQRMLQMFRK